MFTDVMVDLETTGTLSGHCAIVQFSAVKFNLETGAVGGTFDRCLTFAPNRFWQEGGRQFWQKMPDVWKGFVERAEDPALVLQAHIDWIMEDQPQDKGYRFWAKPLSFDWAFVASYYEQYGLPMPYHYRIARDMNSYIAGMRGNAEHPGKSHELPFEGTEHNALWDCFHQIKVLFNAKEMYGK